MTITTKSKRQKGKDYEDMIADLIVEKGLDSKARRDGGSGSGNREKADIITKVQLFGRNLGIEVKNHEKLNIPEWWRQVEQLEKLGREPVLAFKLPKRNPRVNLVCIYLDTFLDMVRALQNVDDIASNVVETCNYDKTQHLNSLTYIIQNLQRAKRDYEKKILKEQ